MSLAGGAPPKLVLRLMPAYCEVALPLPLDRTFTYAIQQGQNPRRGARVIVPFRSEKLVGVVTQLHATAPSDFEVRSIETVLDQNAEDGALLSDHLLTLGEWMAQYYLAPVGEVLRGMLPLSAEVRRVVQYRITDRGRDALAKMMDDEPERASGTNGFPGTDPFTSRLMLSPDPEFREGEERVAAPNADGTIRPVDFSGAVGNQESPGEISKKSSDERDVQRRVLERLAPGEPVRASTLRTATAARCRCCRAAAQEMDCARDGGAGARCAANGAVRGAVPDARLPSLTEKQQAILAELAACGGEAAAGRICARRICLRRRCRRWCGAGWCALKSGRRRFGLGGIESTPPLAAERTADGCAGLRRGRAGRISCLSAARVTGSGKTAVYLAAMQRALDRGLASHSAGAGDRADAADAWGCWMRHSGSKVALLHSALTPEERSEQWRRIQRGEAPIVVGTRSAIFAPVPNLGLILVDEEHDQSYKQEETPRYNARDVAVMRAQAGGRGGGAGFGDAIAGELAELGAGQVHAHRDERSREESSAARSGTDRHAARVSGDGAGAAFLARRWWSRRRRRWIAASRR